MTIEVGYWKIRGLVGGVRIMLEYAGADWKETMYEVHQKEDGSWDRSEWTDLKKTKEIQDKFDFPNLPWMMDGDVALTQSTTILKYIARKFNIGTSLNATEAWRVDLATDQVADVRSGFVGLCYGFRTPFDQRESYCKDTLTPQLVQLDSFMKGVKFVAGEQVTYVDFMFWEILDHMNRFDSALFNNMDNLKGYMERFAALPKVKSYITSDKFMTGPCNNKMAKWGGDKELKRTW
jgi:glutathione S-transferase